MAVQFEITHGTNGKCLWTSWVGSGKAKSIHTVALDEPLRLSINLKYCKTGKDSFDRNGILIHTPKTKGSGAESIVGKLQRTLEGFLDEGGTEDASVELTDFMGQRLRLCIENKIGGGGQRHIVVYCPYWIVNTSQYAFRIRDEGSQHLPAGTKPLTS